MLTETWAAAYFQSLIMILIFVLGVPALLLQVVAPTVDLHRLVQRRFRISIQAYLVLLSAVGITVFFAWNMHPDNKGWAQPALRYANGLMSCAILIAGGAWTYYFHRFTRTGIIHRLKGKILTSHRRRRIAHEEAERNLGFLGEMSRAGREKEQILRVFAIIFGAVIPRESYDGTRLLLIVEGVKRTLLTPGHFGNERNFRSGARLLREARKLIQEHPSKNLSNASDLRWIDETVATLARVAASASFQACHELLDQLAPEKLLEVGVAAWRVGGVTIYTHAVGKLRSQYLRAQSRREETDKLLVPLLALLAHLGSGGPSARRWSEEQLAELRKELGETEFQKELKRAGDERYHVGDFDSADALAVLCDRLDISRDRKNSTHLRLSSKRDRKSWPDYAVLLMQAILLHVLNEG